MPTINTDIEFEAFCSECKRGICGNFDYRQSYNRGAHQFTVEPCGYCLDSAREEGYEKGQKDNECTLEHKE